MSEPLRQINLFGGPDELIPVEAAPPDAPSPEPEPEPAPEPPVDPSPPDEQRWDDPNQELLFELPPKDWEAKWRGMPSYEHENLEAVLSVKVHFKTRQDWVDFFRKIEQPTARRSIWFPYVRPTKFAHTRWRGTDDGVTQPRYPVYIISKGRWESRLTSKELERIHVPYRIVVEPQEYDAYAAVIDPAKILVLPFSNLGLGSIPARNWVWEHSISEGAARHWILDDNLRKFCRFQNNAKRYVADGAIFHAAEDFTERYENVRLSGFQYYMFMPRKRNRMGPITINTRIYSCILIDNSLEIRWRGRYNEDTDLSLRVLKAGDCTILFNAFLAMKMQTMTMKGGNTDVLYQDDGRLRMAESLLEQHADCVKVITRWNRPQHYVNYHRFRHNLLRLRPGLEIQDAPDEYGMVFDPGDAEEPDDLSADLEEGVEVEKRPGVEMIYPAAPAASAASDEVPF